MRRLCVLCALCACQEFTAPPEWVQFDPPAWYAQEWRAMEVCTGYAYPFSRITWYRAVPSGSACWEGECHAAFWIKGADAIVIDDEWTHSHHIVRHEAIHALIRSVDHDDPVWECNRGKY